MKTILNYVNHSILKYSERPLFIEPKTGETVSYKQFKERLSQVSQLLRLKNVQPGDVVTLIIDNSIDLLTYIFGCMVNGVIANPLNPKLLAHEFTIITEHAAPVLIVKDHAEHHQINANVRVRVKEYLQFEPECEDMQKDVIVNEKSPALLIYTSGSTGKPKGVVLHHRNIVSNVLTAIERFPYESQHTTLCLLPLFHTFGFISDVCTMLFSGGRAVIMDVFEATRMKEIEQTIRAYEVNSFSAVPLIYDMLVRLHCNLAAPSMKFCVSGAAPLSSQTAHMFQEQYQFPIIPAYGLTETVCFTAISPFNDINYKSVGVPANLEILVIGDDGTALDTHEIGEFVVRGDQVFEGGYFKDPASASEDGWFHTGDLGYYDEQGYYFIVGRKKNMIIRGGEKVYLEDIDQCLTSFNGIKDHATIRVNEGDTEKIACVLVLEAGITIEPKQVKQFLVERVGPKRVPDYILIHDHIPRTPTNKVKIAQLAETVLHVIERML
ncbi:class I adenylate-forming enzyme family protein [Paenibacillus sp. KN14-4R]|uniref:class I adenylate-forming enzyme family protein n=1 Tax=Paenibacillus sp. KN14-4R TaxID=3445773 RepID=UPI003FA17BF4